MATERKRAARKGTARKATGRKTGAAARPDERRVLVTGAGGYIGRLTVRALAAARDDGAPIAAIVATDVREQPADDRVGGVVYEIADVRDDGLGERFAAHRVDTVVHLAAIVNPGRKPDRALEYQVDVVGTAHVLQGCRDAGVGQLIVTSSGAAYGYHADNPAWLDEGDALRGNPEFTYSDHKRQVEEMLTRWRIDHPALKQLIFRPGVILGETTRNQITDLFDGRFVLGVAGSDSPFVMIWDEDVAAAIVRGVLERSEGIYNLAGDGAIAPRELARLLGKPFLPLPVRPTRAALWVLKRLGRTQYGPEQLDFLRYRPVLSNRRLKDEFGFVPRKTTRQVFDLFMEARARAAGGDA